MSDAIYIQSLIQTIRSLLNSIERSPGVTSDVIEFASSAIHKLGLLDSQLAKIRNPEEFTKRRGDRGYMGPSTLPYSGTITLPKDKKD